MQCVEVLVLSLSSFFRDLSLIQIHEVEHVIILVFFAGSVGLSVSFNLVRD